MHRHARNAQRGIADSLRACHPLTVCARVYGSSICLSPAMPLYAMHRPSHARVSHSAPSTAVSPSETRRVLCGCFVRGPCQSIILATHCPTQTVLPGRGTRVAVAASAPGLGSPAPHLRRDWAHPRHICAGTGLTRATSAPGLGSLQVVEAYESPEGKSLKRSFEATRLKHVPNITPSLP
jgi:hypothetical protein